MKKYNVTASCDPYNAHKHYHGEDVIRYDGITPTEWIMERDLTLEEAFDVLDKYACDLGDDYIWMSDDCIADLKAELIKYEELSEREATEAVSWYKGEGVYCNNILVYRRGDMDIRDDVMRYGIEEVE